MATVIWMNFQDTVLNRPRTSCSKCVCQQTNYSYRPCRHSKDNHQFKKPGRMENNSKREIRYQKRWSKGVDKWKTKEIHFDLLSQKKIKKKISGRQKYPTLFYFTFQDSFLSIQCNFKSEILV